LIRTSPKVGFLLCGILLLISACTGLPKNVSPVDEFELDRYLGEWYEIARLDHRFERGLRNVTANYSLRKGGGIIVNNKGYSEEKGEWKEATGKAFAVGSPDVAHLKVSFFGPFYGSYAVFDLDKERYQHAFVSGNTTKYLWLLSRTPTVSEELLARFKEEAQKRGFDTAELIMVDQSPVAN